jgi:protein tyrosine/serine phosphatase
MLKRLRNTGVVLAVAILIMAGYVLAVNIQGNFHPITPGEAYRSGQLNSNKLARCVEQYKIKSVLNLRGSHPGEDWYEDELAASSKLQLVHYDISLSASHELTEADVRKLIGIFKTAPRPVLIHCQAGADRSGLVAAMWQVVVDKVSKAEAKKQLSLWYGHIAIGEKRAMDNSFEKWNP